uniref:Methionyl aminopeptidase 1 n=1 Tax=Jaculus jaculus TaxID=51337 RepID=A0A8C5KC53_JACJA
LYRNGYHGDLNETFFVGDVDEGARKLVQTTYECLMQAIDAENKAVGVMKSGHVFTIEPMICEGGWQDETWPDGWTAVTRDGKRSAQFEHTLLVTDTGCEILTRRLDSSQPHFMSQF